MSGIVLFVVVPAALISGWILATLIFKLARLERVQKAAPGERTFNRLHNAVRELGVDVEELAERQDHLMEQVEGSAAWTRWTVTQMEGSLVTLERRLESLSVEVRTLLLEFDRLPERVADQMADRAQIRQAASGTAGEGDDDREEGPLIFS